MEIQKALTHIYCGDGKGKTTAAIGLGIRMAGSGKRVKMVQFLKSSPTSELAILETIPNIEVIRSDRKLGFTFAMTDEEKKLSREIQQELFEKARTLIQGIECDMLILDEIMAAMSCNMIDEAQVVELVESKPDSLELVLTGRNPPAALIELADYVSEIKKVKHPYDKGVPSRKGIEE